MLIKNGITFALNKWFEFKIAPACLFFYLNGDVHVPTCVRVLQDICFSLSILTNFCLFFDTLGNMDRHFQLPVLTLPSYLVFFSNTFLFSLSPKNWFLSSCIAFPRRIRCNDAMRHESIFYFCVFIALT